MRINVDAVIFQPTIICSIKLSPTWLQADSMIRTVKKIKRGDNTKYNNCFILKRTIALHNHKH